MASWRSTPTSSRPTRPVAESVTPAGLTVTWMLPKEAEAAAFQVEYGHPFRGKWRGAEELAWHEDPQPEGGGWAYPTATGVVDARRWRATIEVAQELPQYVLWSASESEPKIAPTEAKIPIPGAKSARSSKHHAKLENGQVYRRPAKREEANRPTGGSKSALH